MIDQNQMGVQEIDARVVPPVKNYDQASIGVPPSSTPSLQKLDKSDQELVPTLAGPPNDIQAPTRWPNSPVSPVARGPVPPPPPLRKIKRKLERFPRKTKKPPRKTGPTQRILRVPLLSPKWVKDGKITNGTSATDTGAQEEGG